MIVKIHLPIFFLVASLALPLAAAEKVDITLNDGRVLKGARVVSIGEKSVTILHSGGVQNFATGLVPSEIVAGAITEAKKPAEKPLPASYLNEAEARAAPARPSEKTKQLPAPVPVASPAAMPTQNRQLPRSPRAGISLTELKEKFPRKQVRTATYLKNKQLVLRPVTVQVSQAQGNTVVTTARRTAEVAVVGSPDTMSMDVPHTDVYSFYQGMVRTATEEGVPRTLRMIDDRIESDTARLRGETGSWSNSLNSLQAKLTIEWIDTTLRPYLAQLRALAAR
jgi:hypothetical protein